MAYDKHEYQSRGHQAPKRENSYKKTPMYRQWKTKKRIELPKDKADYRQQDCINNPKTLEGIEQLAKLIGKEAAYKYFDKFYTNLKYEEKEK